MPASTMRFTPSARSSSRSARMPGTRAREFSGASTQPRRTEASARADSTHTVASLAAMRLATFSATSDGTWASMAACAAPVAMNPRELISRSRS